MKAGLGFGGQLWWVPWQILGSRPPPGAQKPFSAGGRADRRQAAPVSIITVISWAIKQHGPGQPLKEGPVSPGQVCAGSALLPPTRACGGWTGPCRDEDLHSLGLGTHALHPRLPQTFQLLWVSPTS